MTADIGSSPSVTVASITHGVETRTPLLIVHCLINHSPSQKRYEDLQTKKHSLDQFQFYSPLLKLLE